LRLRPGAPDAQLADAEDRLGVRLPADLRDLLHYTDGFEDVAGHWECGWSIERLVAENLHAWRQRMLLGSLLAFGDDGASTCFCVSTREGDAQVTRWSWIGQDVEATYPDLRSFWRLWLRPGADN
jgi:cell wall assembly regulator SMI1